jgi:hypothetical protein
MKYYTEYLKAHMTAVMMALFACFIVGCVMFYKLGSLTNGLSMSESTVATNVYGWHGLYRMPLFLPIDAVRSVIFRLFTVHTPIIIRSSSVIFGFLSIISFGLLLWLWHGSRIATLGTILFVSSAWSLHISRIGTNDVIYLLAPTLLLLSCLALHRKSENYIVLYSVIIISGILLYIPGMIWFIVINTILQRKDILKGWKRLDVMWKQILAVLLSAIWLPLLH